MALKPAVTNAAKTTAACNAALDAVHTDMRAVYPASGELAPALNSLCGRSEAVTQAAALKAAEDELKEVLLKQVDVKIQEVKTLVDTRAQLREEVDHYVKKLSEIKPTAGQDPVKLKRVEENEKKLSDTKEKFATTEAALLPVLASLDADLAALTGGPFAKYLSSLKDATHAIVNELQQGLAGVPAPVAAAPAGAAS